MSHSHRPLVSVIIPVYNDGDKLKKCLTALEQQTYPSDRYEIIVVDNNSQESIKDAVQAYKSIILAFEERPGSYIARNRGIALSQGDILAFTDADCIPSPQWLEKGVAALQSIPNVGLVAGRIDLFPKDPQNPNPFELYESIVMGFPQQDFIEQGRFGVTANLFTFRSVLKTVGDFDETLKSGGDRQWGERVFAKGYKQLYCDDAAISHPARDTWQSIRKRSIRITGGRYDLLKQELSEQALFNDLIKSLKPPFRTFFRIWKDGRLKDWKQKAQFTWVMLRVRQVVIRERLRLQLGSGISERE